MHSIKVLATIAATCSSLFAAHSDAAPQFVNGVVIPGNTLDATEQPGANQGRFGFFSDLYYDPEREEWWALSDRGPGGGVIDYATRVQRLKIKLDKNHRRHQERGYPENDQVHRSVGDPDLTR